MSVTGNGGKSTSTEMVVRDENTTEADGLGSVAVRLGGTSLRVNSRRIRMAHESDSMGIDINATYSLRNPNRNKEVNKVLNKIDKCSLVNGWEVLWIDKSDINKFIHSIFGDVQISSEETALMSLWRMGGAEENVDMGVFGLEGRFETHKCGIGAGRESDKSYFPYSDVALAVPINYEDLEAAKYDISDDVYPRVFNHGVIIDVFNKIMKQDSLREMEYLDTIVDDVSSAIKSDDIDQDFLRLFRNSWDEIEFSSQVIMDALKKVARYCEDRHLIPYYSEIKEELYSWDKSNGFSGVDGTTIGVRIILYQFGIHTCSNFSVLQAGQDIICRGPRGIVENQLDHEELASFHFYTIYRKIKTGGKEERVGLKKFLNFQDLLYQEKTKYNGCPQLALIYRWWLRTDQYTPRPKLIRCVEKFKATITMLLEWIKLGMESNSNEKITERKKTSVSLVERIFIEEVVFKSKTTSINSLMKRKVMIIGSDVLFYDFMSRKICVLDSVFVEQILTDKTKMQSNSCVIPYELLNENLICRMSARIIISLLYKTPHGRELTGGLMGAKLEEICLEGRIGHTVEVSVSEVVNWAETMHLKNIAEKSAFIRDMLLLLSKSGCSADKNNGKSCYNKVVSECVHPLHTVHYDSLVPLDGLEVQKAKRYGINGFSARFTALGGKKFEIVKPVRGKAKMDPVWTSKDIKGRVHIVEYERTTNGEMDSEEEIESVQLEGVSAGMTLDNTEAETDIEREDSTMVSTKEEEERKTKILIKIGVLTLRFIKEENEEDYAGQEATDREVKNIIEREYKIPSDTKKSEEVFKRILIYRQAEQAVTERRHQITQKLNLLKKSEKKVIDDTKQGVKSNGEESNRVKYKKTASDRKEEAKGIKIGNDRMKKPEELIENRHRTELKGKGTRRKTTQTTKIVRDLKSQKEKTKDKSLKKKERDDRVKKPVKKECGTSIAAEHPVEVCDVALVSEREEEKADEERRGGIPLIIGKKESSYGLDRLCSDVGVIRACGEREINRKPKRGSHIDGEKITARDNKTIVTRKKRKKMKTNDCGRYLEEKKDVHVCVRTQVRKEVLEAHKSASSTVEGKESARADKLGDREVIEEITQTFKKRCKVAAERMMKKRKKEKKKRKSYRVNKKSRFVTKTKINTLPSRLTRDDSSISCYSSTKKITLRWKSDSYYGNRPKLKLGMSHGDI